jgi:hypothetical protein
MSAYPILCFCSALDKELASLIMDGQIAARIDSGAGVLYARHADARTQTFSRVLATCQDYLRDTKVQETTGIAVSTQHGNAVTARSAPAHTTSNLCTGGMMALGLAKASNWYIAYLVALLLSCSFAQHRLRCCVPSCCSTTWLSNGVRMLCITQSCSSQQGKELPAGAGAVFSAQPAYTAAGKASCCLDAEA